MEHEITLFDFLRVLKKRKKLIGVFVSICTVISVIYALLATEIYKVDATIMPIGGSSASGLAMALSQSGLGGLLGGAMGSETSSSLMAILKSRTLAEIVIRKLDLMKIFYEKLWDKEKGTWKTKNGAPPEMEDAIGALLGIVDFTGGLNTELIVIEAQFKNSEQAATIVNGYIKELGNYLVKNELTSAKRNRIFIKNQLDNNKVQVLETGKELSRFYSKNQITSRDSRIDVNVGLNAPKDLPVDKEKIAALEEEKTNLKRKLNEARLVTNVPQQVYLEYLSSYYQLLGRVNALLTQQYEMAKINEAKEDISFQVIDWAHATTKKFKPKRRVIVTVTFAASFFMAAFIAFSWEYLKEILKAERSNDVLS